jgi:membrane associated rhomboid family serine protease
VRPDFRHAALTAVVAVSLLWLIELGDRAFNLHLYRLGIFPREAAGMWGILFAPLIHGSWGHLISNSFALLVLGTALLYGYPRSARPVLLLVYFASGLCVWLFARSSYHFGASGLTHGMMFFVFASGILRRDRLSIALALIVFFIYGGMVWSIFPQQEGISYESHFFGAAAGLLAAFLFRHRDPVPAEKSYEWEGEEEDRTSVSDPQGEDPP